MDGGEERVGFAALSGAGADDAAAKALATRLKAGSTPADLKALAALWLHAAAAAPERVVGIYDAAAEGWLGAPVAGPAVRVAEAPLERIPQVFWDGLWDLLAESERNLGAVNLTTRTAALTGLISPSIEGRVAKAAMAYPGVPAAAAQG
ncbi:MAG: hypothetical protein JWQ29_690, partial [Phenylobacterium sp.]|nr:hypothetical protein [Phenylobacterium sp.]